MDRRTDRGDNTIQNNEINLTDLTELVHKVIDGNLLIKSVLKGSGMYNEVVENLPDIFLILYHDTHGKEILNNLGLLQYLEQIKSQNNIK